MQEALGQQELSISTPPVLTRYRAANPALRPIVVGCGFSSKASGVLPVMMLTGQTPTPNVPQDLGSIYSTDLVQQGMLADQVLVQRVLRLSVCGAGRNKFSWIF